MLVSTDIHTEALNTCLVYLTNCHSADRQAVPCDMYEVLVRNLLSLLTPFTCRLVLPICLVKMLRGYNRTHIHLQLKLLHCEARLTACHAPSYNVAEERYPKIP